MFRRIYLLLVLLTPLAGCSAPQGYDFVRDLGESKARCDRRLTTAEREECEAAYRREYEEYREQRKEILSAPSDESAGETR